MINETRLLEGARDSHKEHKISDSCIILNSLLFFCVFSVTEYIVILGNNKNLKKPTSYWVPTVLQALC